MRIRMYWYLVLLLAAAASLGAQEQSTNQGFVTVQEILKRHCGTCHGEVNSHQNLMASSWVLPGSPEKSPLYTTIADGSMPPGEPLAVTEKNLLRSWISTGAESTDAPIAVTLPGESDGGLSTPVQAAPRRYLGFSSRVKFHQFSGFTSGSMLLAAGVIGAVQYGTFIAESHAYRDSLGIDDEDEIGSQCYTYINDLWTNPMHTALRWTHVGLLIGGETLYLANAATGLGMLSKDDPGLTPRDLHRYAFFVHGALMIAEVVMGFLTTSVLKNGTHEQIIAFGITHSAVGLAIPIVVLGSGIAINTAFR